jgi:hypothetical protein
MSIKKVVNRKIRCTARIDGYESCGRAVEVVPQIRPTWTSPSGVGHVNGSMHRRVSLVSFTAYHPLLSVSAQRACHRSLCQDTSLLHPYHLPDLFFFNDHERKCQPCPKLCLSWRPATRAPSPIYLFLPFWMTERTYLYLAARMGTRCCANGPAIGSAPLSVIRGRFGAPSSVAMRRALRQVVQTLQRASPLSYTACAPKVCSPTQAQVLRLLQ